MPVLNKLKLHMPDTIDYTYTEKCVSPLTQDFDEDILYDVCATITPYTSDGNPTYWIKIDISIIDPRHIFELDPIIIIKREADKEALQSIIDNINSRLDALVNVIDAYASFYSEYELKKRQLIESIGWQEV